MPKPSIQPNKDSMIVRILKLAWEHWIYSLLVLIFTGLIFPIFFFEYTHKRENIKIPESDLTINEVKLSGESDKYRIYTIFHC